MFYYANILYYVIFLHVLNLCVICYATRNNGSKEQQLTETFIFIYELNHVLLNIIVIYFFVREVEKMTSVLSLFEIICTRLVLLNGIVL